MIRRFINKITGWREWYSVKVEYSKSDIVLYKFSTVIGLIDRRDSVSQKKVGRLFQNHLWNTSKEFDIHLRNGEISIFLSYLGWFKEKRT